MPSETTTDGWNDLLNTEWDDLPWAHERDDALGRYYWDQPWGGFLVVAETEAYYHDDDGTERTVRLGIGVEFIDGGEQIPDPSETGYLADAKAVVHPDSLTESSRNDVAGVHGWDDDTDLTYHDVATYGYSVPLEDANGETWQEAYEQVKSTLALANMGVGFLLDRPMNRIGTTGWDMIRDANDDVDAHDAALERAKEHHAD
jgi:hypothetical protein